MSENSVITYIRREKLCKVTSGAIPTIPPITHVAFGTGGNKPDGDPIPPKVTQTTLTAEVARYPIESVEYPLSTTARYTVRIPESNLPGVTINEAALVDAEGDIAAIKTMYSKRKDVDVEFVFSFDDEY